MRTAFSPDQLADPEVAASAGAIRRCVHCGFCTATCPTYVLTGDERDSPRGRIELIRDMLEKGGPPPASTVTHIDRCLSCLACTTTCPSGVDYAQLIDHARAHIEAHYERPWPQRALRTALAWVLTEPKRLKWALRLGRVARPLEPLLRGLGLKPIAAMLRLLPSPLRGGVGGGGVSAVRAGSTPTPNPLPARGRGRVVLLQGCVEAVMAPQVRAAAMRLLARCGYEVAPAPGEVCCGAIPEHLGRPDEARALARTNLAAWARAGKVTAIVTTAAGCGTTLKAYGKLVGQAVPAKDLLEFIGEVGLPPVTPGRRPSVAYHAACSLQHGQQIKAAPQRLLREAGYEVREVREGHLCCGSAGVYNILESELATQLRDRKAANIAATEAAVVAAANVGCMVQLAPALDAPILHPVELLDWATGGPCPAVLAGPQAPP